MAEASPQGLFLYMSSKSTSPNHRQAIYAYDPILGSVFEIQGTTANGAINVNASATLSGSALPISGATTAVGVAIVDGSGNQITSFGGGTQYTDGGVPPTHPVGNTIEWNDGSNWQTVSTAKPLPVTATFSPSGTQDVNLKQIGGTTTLTGNGVAGAGAQRVTIASDNTAFSVNATLSAETTKVIGTVNQGTSPWVVSGTVTTSPPSNASTNIAQINGVTPLMGNGVTGTGSQRVTIASDNTAFSVNATLSAETTKVIGVTRTADGSGNLLTSTTNALDINIKSGSIANTTFAATQATASSLNATVVQGIAAAVSAGWPVIGGELADTTGTFTNATQTTSVTTSSFDGYSTVIVSISGTYGTATGVFEISDDGGTTWYSVNAARTDGSAVETGYTGLTNTNRMWTLSVSGADEFRVRSTAVASGTVNVRISVESMPTPEAASVSAYQATGTNLHTVVDSGTITAVTAITNALPAGTNALGSVNVLPATSGGWTTFHLASAGSTNATNLKASAGQVGGWYIYNSNAVARKVAFHNTAGTPTAGSAIFFAIVIPPGAGANVEYTNGIPFSTGIAITTVTGLSDSDNTAVAVNDLIANIWYK